MLLSAIVCKLYAALATLTVARTNIAVSVVMQVEKAPVVIKAGISKAEAEEMSKKIEAGESWHYGG